jgi:hypothetical protein
MINSLNLNKLLILLFFLNTLFLQNVYAEEEPADIWESQEVINKPDNNETNQENLIIKSPILSEDANKITIQIDENEIEKNNESLIGIYDPEVNNFNLNMWSKTDGEDIKKVFQRINKLKLSKVSEDLLFQVLFTNAYSPEKNLSSDEFLKIKINWLIKNNRINDLKILLKNNPQVLQNSKAVKFLINEYISSGDIQSACENENLINRGIQNDYLEKLLIYCLIKNNQKEKAQIIFDLLKESGFKDKFFEDKINFLLGITNTTDKKILDNNLLNFYLSHVTNNDFDYKPNEKTDKYIWRYLSYANLIKVNDFEDENTITAYEQAASKNSFEKDEIFKIYLKMNYSFTELINSEEIYKSLPSYKARALIYQSILLSDNVERKIYLSFLLRDLFIKDKILEVYQEELSTILKSINSNDIPENYIETVEQYLNKNSIKKVKFNNEVLHKSKVIKYFLEENYKLNKTEKDFKSVYKKIKKNKKYFVSIKDIVVLESLAADGMSIPDSLNYNELTSKLSVPKNLENLASQNQIGLVMLKIVEIIGEDNVSDLDPETVFFLNRILNVLNLKKIRNNILSHALPDRI